MAIPVSDRKWDQLDPPLSEKTMKVLQKLNFEFMTPVQGATIPHFMKNKDVAVEAVTGSGKTLAFVIPLLEILSKVSRTWTGKGTGALVLTPTRELASQITGVLENFLKIFCFKTLLLIGGTDVHDDVARINAEGGQIIVATPGRLVDLLGRPSCSLAGSLRNLEVLVLDEADRLLELGFELSVNTILSYCPKQRRTGLFSATLNSNVKALIRAGLRNPVTITVKDKRTAKDKAPTPKSLSNYFLVCDPANKLSVLLKILAEKSNDKVIVFFATCASVGYFSAIAKKLLPERNVVSMHGKMHKKRQQLFKEFFESLQAVLMCTDVMARGVDFPSVDLVIQFDPPSSTSSFVHRCGRTARLGKQGEALVMLLPSEVAYVEFLSVNQHIVLKPYEMTLESASCKDHYVQQVRNLAAKEREIYEEGIRAYVSFVHFYFKHECKLIFHPKELDLVGLAMGYALLHLPKMPELRGVDASKFDFSYPDLSEIKYKDKAREKQRIQKLERDVIEKSEKKSFSRKVKPGRIKGSKAHLKSRKKRKAMSDSDLEELAAEARLLKKFKAGKISKEELDDKLDCFSDA